MPGKKSNGKKPSREYFLKILRQNFPNAFLPKKFKMKIPLHSSTSIVLKSFTFTNTVTFIKSFV